MKRSWTPKQEELWERIQKKIPEICWLYYIAQHIKDNKKENSFCANRIFYNIGGFKERLSNLVGWEAKDKEFQTEEAYDVTYEKIYDVLPSCRNCGEIGG